MDYSIRPYRNEIRTLARKHWEETGDPELSKKLVISSIENKYGSIIATILISVFIRLAVELIVYWFSNRIANPPMSYQSGEPGF